MKTIDINLKMTECSKSVLAPEDLALVDVGIDAAQRMVQEIW